MSNSMRINDLTKVTDPSPSQLAEVRWMLAQGRTPAQIAEDTRIPVSSIRRIARGIDNPGDSQP